jgi:dephospho-CoA kinase
MIVIGTVGLNGSGKDTLIQYLHQRCGIPMLSMGDLVREIAARRGIPPTRPNLHMLSQQAIEQHGADFFAKKLIARIEEAPWEVVGITGIRTPADVSAFSSHFGDDFILVHVRVSNPRTRFERVQRRDEARDPQSYERFLRQDREEREMFDIEGAAEKADIAIDNEGSLHDFYSEIEAQVFEQVLGDSEQD